MHEQSPRYPALQAVAVFSALYGVVLVSGVPALGVPGLQALVALVAGFLLAFPVARLPGFLLWAAEAQSRAQEYRTCVLSSPGMKREARHWRLIGAIRERRA